MADRPIIFSGPMVRALLQGAKTQTRRVLKPQPFWDHPCQGEVTGEVYAPMTRRAPMFQFRTTTTPNDPQMIAWRAPFCYVRDCLWTRETWATDAPDLDTCRDHAERGDLRYGPYYYADGGWDYNASLRKRPSIHMPKWASRLTLHVQDVRVQRLQDISEEDAVAEGCSGYRIEIEPRGNVIEEPSPVNHFAELWKDIHGDGAWDANPWVCAITFEVEHANIDKARAAGVAP